MSTLIRSYENFRALRPSVRSLIYLFWIYALAGSMIGVFTQLFLYQKFTSVSLNITATMVFYTGIMLGFCVPGLVAAFLRLNLKQAFLWSFLIMALSIACLLRVETIAEAYGAMFLWGIGQGTFWLPVNTFELSETKDPERDFYSSMLNAGTQVLSLVGPALASALIWLSIERGLGTYTLLFTAAPAIFLLGFFCFSSIRDYRPSPLQWADVRHYFTDRRNQAAQLYTLGTGIQQITGLVVPPLVILLILGTALRVGIYNTFFAVFSALCIIFIAPYRTPSNRLTIYSIATAVLALAISWFGYALSFAALMVYTVTDGIISPVLGVSSHVIDLSAMEIGRAETDFYATMMLRDLFLWVWRLGGGGILLLSVHIFGAERPTLSAGLYFLAGAFVIQYAGAVLLTRFARSFARGPLPSAQKM